MNLKNDLSFVIAHQLLLYEHQSTVNPNMPLRDLLYVAELIQKWVKDKSVYDGRLVKIPTPYFVVFYNGIDGVVMDKLGARKASMVTLILAAVLYLFCDIPIEGTLAVFLFNATMPITLWVAAKVMPGSKGFAFGLLTFGIFIGILPTCFGWQSVLISPVMYVVVTLISLVLLWLPLGREEMRC